MTAVLSPRAAFAALKTAAAGYPQAFEDHPWGETVFKVGGKKGKVFVFMGGDETGIGISVKLPESCEAVLHMPFAEPTGYGLGKAGWVSIELAENMPIPLPLLLAWLDESYRAVAPKKLVDTLPEAERFELVVEAPRAASRAPNKKPPKRADARSKVNKGGKGPKTAKTRKGPKKATKR